MKYIKSYVIFDSIVNPSGRDIDNIELELNDICTELEDSGYMVNIYEPLGWGLPHGDKYVISIKGNSSIIGDDIKNVITRMIDYMGGYNHILKIGTNDGRPNGKGEYNKNVKIINNIDDITKHTLGVNDYISILFNKITE